MKDPNQPPTPEVLKNALGNSYTAYEKLIGTVTGDAYGLEPVWNYYRDGKAWLCKVIYKKKTVFWLSVWDGYFKTAFYFTEKNAAGIPALEIDEKIKEEFRNRKPVGRLLPLIISIEKEGQIKDVLSIVSYKKQQK